MVYNRILYTYVRYKEFKMTCRRNYVTSCEVVDCIPMNWYFFLKKCVYAYACMKKRNVNKFSIRSTTNQKERN